MFIPNPLLKLAISVLKIADIYESSFDECDEVYTMTIKQVCDEVTGDDPITNYLILVILLKDWNNGLEWAELLVEHEKVRYENWIHSCDQIVAIDVANGDIIVGYLMQK